MFGWQATTKANWKVENGELQVSKGKLGLLRTTAQFDDFEMTLEYKADERTNSGIFLRSSPKPKSVTKECYELNIASPKDHEYFTGALAVQLWQDRVSKYFSQAPQLRPIVRRQES